MDLGDGRYGCSNLQKQLRVINRCLQQWKNEEDFTYVKDLVKAIRLLIDAIRLWKIL